MVIGVLREDLAFFALGGGVISGWQCGLLSVVLISHLIFIYVFAFLFFLKADLNRLA